MAERTAPRVVQTVEYKPCGHCRRCVSGVPLGLVATTADDCYSLYRARIAPVVTPGAQR